MVDSTSIAAKRVGGRQQTSGFALDVSVSNNGRSGWCWSTLRRPSYALGQSGIIVVIEGLLGNVCFPPVRD